LKVCKERNVAGGVVSRAGYCKVVRVGCLFAWNFTVTGSAVLLEAERRTRPNITL